mmetsp:Transcript_23860/g.49710  ORF Transcript_23860/g.49710 Transcript_23860/m.49710 type:complete len:629 (+) Transcript_23860:32-1918(+)
MDHHAASFSMINSLRTGNPAFDMAIAMVIPAVITALFSFMNNSLKPMMLRFFNNMFGEVKEQAITRRIEFTTESTSYYSSGNKEGRDKRNNILQKALMMYIGEHCGAVKFNNANISLMAAKEKGHRDTNTWEMQYGSTAEQLKNYTVTTVPPKDEWVTVSKGVKFRECVENENEEEGNGENKKSLSKKITLFLFSSTEPNGGELIDNYIKTAFDWYTEQVGMSVDKARYMYMCIQKDAPLSSDENNDEGKKYKRYKLSDRKTFKSMFFKEKENLLHLFDNFLKKKGKYAIPGYPDKLGLLLFGPPGTGKTSLIKAMASHTGRSIINISLSKIKTNQELMDIFFDQKFSVKDEELPVKLSFSDVIFVLEDVDAASKIVHKRTKGKYKPKSTVVTTTKQVIAGDDAGAVVPASSPRSQAMESDAKDHGVEAKDKALMPPPPSLVREVSTTVVEKTSKVTRTETSQTENDGLEDSDEEGGEDDAMFKAIATALGGDDGDSDKAVGPKLLTGNKDKLDLAGLLNVLDGVVDTPDRIVIMTTNHPEKLDAALIRPGRIDKKIYLGYLGYESAIEMIKHYFGLSENELEGRHKEMIMKVFETHKNITPAVFEQYCSEHDDIKDFCEKAAEFFKV